MSKCTILVMLAATLGGGAVGWWARPQTASPHHEIAVPVAAAPIARPVTVQARPSLDADDIREIVRSELSQARATASEEMLEARRDSVAEQHSADAHAKARTLVDSIKHSRRLGPDEAAQLRAQFHEMTDAQRQEIASALLPAINRQEIRVDVDGPIF
jgi:hypothetical protein